MRLTHLLSCSEEEIDGIGLSLCKEGYDDKPAQQYSERFARETTPMSEGHVTQHTHTTHRYNAETQVKRQAGRGGSRNGESAVGNMFYSRESLSESTR